MQRLVAFACVFALLVGCGQPTVPDRADNVQRNEQREGSSLADEIAAATAGLGTARTFGEQVMRFAPSAGGGTVTMTSAGVVDFEQQLQSALMKSEGTGRFGKTVATQIGTSEVMSQGLVVYMKSAIFQQAPGVKEWVKMDLEAIGEEMGLDLGSVMQMNQNDPTASLDYMRGLDDVEELGEEKVRGVSTTHYRGTGSFEALKDELGPEAGPTLDKMQEMLGIDGFELDAWVDKDQVARRVEIDYDALPIPGTEGTWTVMMEFYDFGVDVDVDLPPPHKVTDVLDLMQR